MFIAGKVELHKYDTIYIDFFTHLHIFITMQIRLSLFASEQHYHDDSKDE